jgi:hypothetical protein
MEIRLLHPGQLLPGDSSVRIAITCPVRIPHHKRATKLNNTNKIPGWSRSDAGFKKRKAAFSVSVTSGSGSVKRLNDESARNLPHIMLHCPRKRFQWHSRRSEAGVLIRETQALRAETDTILVVQRLPLLRLLVIASNRRAPFGRWLLSARHLRRLNRLTAVATLRLRKLKLPLMLINGLQCSRAPSIRALTTKSHAPRTGNNSNSKSMLGPHLSL